MYTYMAEVNTLIDEAINIRKIKNPVFYEGRINGFFNKFMSGNNINRPLDTITYYDIKTYLVSLNCSDSEKVNIYSALKFFFEYTYLKGITKEIMSQVERPIYTRKQKETLSEDEYIKLKKFIVCRSNNLYERLLLGLFLFTGLSRKYVSNLRNNDFKFENGVYKLAVWKDDKEIILPLKSELQLIINEYCISLSEKESLNKFARNNENQISDDVSKLIKPIIGRRCTPTMLSNTFIAKALSNGNYIYEIGKLTLETVKTIEDHIKEDDVDLINKQTSILNSF